MNDDAMATNPGERLVEVLLEELHGRREVAATRRRGASVHGRWLVAACVLLGALVVVGVGVLRARGAVAPATTQDPKPETRINGAVDVGRDDQARFLDDLGGFYDTLKADTYSSKNGKTTGLIVKGIDPKASSSFGVAPGDVLLEINGRKVESKAQARSLAEGDYKRGVRTFQTKWLSGGQAVDRTIQVPDSRGARANEPLVVKSFEQWQQLVGDIVRIRCWVPGVASPSIAERAAHPPTADSVLEDPKQLAEFLAGVPVLAGPAGLQADPSAHHARLTFELRDGRFVAGGFAQDGGREVFSLSVMKPVELQPGPFLDTLRRLQADAFTISLVARGIASTLDELARVPADAIAIQCPMLPPGEVAKHLGRFERLEWLEQSRSVRLTAGPQTIDTRAPARIAEFAVLPHLRHLRFEGQGFGDLDAADLDRLPKLTSVRVDGGLVGLSDGGRRRFVSRLDDVELVSVHGADAIVQAVVAAKRAQRVALFGADLTADTFAALAAMPTLRVLDLTGIEWTDAHLAALVTAKTGLERLRLQTTQTTVEGLRGLAALPSLQELDLRRAGLRADAIAVLREALPRCRVVAPGETAGTTGPFDGQPGATRR